MKIAKKRIVAILALFALVFALIAACAETPADETLDADPPQQDDTAVPPDDGDDTADPPPEGRVFQQSPFLDGRDLPPVHERLPLNPKLTNEIPPEIMEYEIGRFGGTIRLLTPSVDWDADVFVMLNEPLVNSPAMLGREVTGNILEGYDVTDDQMTFTFYLREGLRWSDGEPLTMEDFRFTI